MSDAPPGWGGLPDQPGNGRLPDLQWSMASEIELRPIHWIDKPFLLDSTFHLLVGKKAVGKGLWLVDTVARMTRGELGPKTGVLWLSMSEDSYAVDLVPRLMAANAELAEVACLTNGHILLPEQSELLNERIQPHIGLVVIDPLVGTLGAASANNDWEIRPMLQCLNRLADEREVIVIGIRHFSIKAGSNEAIASVLGSTAWVDVPRMVLGVFRDDEQPDMRHLFVLAGNRTTPEPNGVMFHLGGVDLDGHKEPVPKASILGTSLKDPNELLAAKTPRADTSGVEKLLLQTLLDAPGREMLSDLLDTYVAGHTGVAVKTIQNLRWKIGSRGTGLIKAYRPPGDPNTPWMVMLTEAGRRVAEGQSVDDFVTPPPSPPTSSYFPESSSSEDLGSWAVEQDPPDPPDPERLPLPPTATPREREMWRKRGWLDT